jgi:UDP-N-acetylmuramate--alanine ligase
VLEGRRIYFVGIGGAGLSAYAFLARAWGAEVAGWDVRETPYLRALDGVHVDLGGEPRPPEGWEVVVSSAHRNRAAGTSRAEFLAELVSLRDSIVVAGAHGKTTTTAMIAFVLRELGRDPAWLIGGEVPQLGGNAAAGGGWLVVEGDESDRTVERLGRGRGRPRTSSSTTTRRSRREARCSGCSTSGSRRRRRRPRLGARAGRPRARRARGAQPPNAAAALAALERAGSPREAAPVLARFRGAGAASSSSGEAGGVTVVDDYAHHPAEIAATLAAPRAHAGRVLVLFQPHLYSRTRHLARSSARRSRRRRGLRARSLPAREEPLDGVTGARRRRARAARARRRGRRPSRTACEVLRRGRVRATSCSTSAPATSTVPARCSSRRSRERRGGRPLARHTTIGTGGPARAFARPETLDELDGALRWAAERGSRSPSSASARTCSSPTRASTRSSSGSPASSPARGRRRAARRRRRRGERGLPAPRAGGGPRRLRVRVRDPREPQAAASG